MRPNGHGPAGRSVERVFNFQPSRASWNFRLDDFFSSPSQDGGSEWGQNGEPPVGDVRVLWKDQCVPRPPAVVQIQYTEARIHPDHIDRDMLRGYDTRVLQHFIKQVQLLLISELRVPQSANQLSEPVHLTYFWEEFGVPTNPLRGQVRLRGSWGLRDRSFPAFLQKFCVELGPDQD